MERLNITWIYFSYVNQQGKACMHDCLPYINDGPIVEKICWRANTMEQGEMKHRMMKDSDAVNRYDYHGLVRGDHRLPSIACMA
jgi:hypothetical protein